jgi:hypothetical protein
MDGVLKHTGNLPCHFYTKLHVAMAPDFQLAFMTWIDPSIDPDLFLVTT